MGVALQEGSRDASSNAEKKETAIARRRELSHALLDSALLVALLAAFLKFGNLKTFFKRFMDGVKTFPNHYTPQFNWQKEPMSKLVAVSTWVTGVYFLLKTYVVEKDVVNRAHKKYTAHKNTLAVAAHGAGSALEITVGCLACCYPAKTAFTKVASALAINNVVSGFMLTPGVFGIKHLTVPGFYLFGWLRSVEIVRTLCYDYRNYPQAWILLQVGTVVRLLGFWVLPYTSTDGVRGDLFTEPSIYSFNILLSGYLTAAFVYPPKWVLSSLLLYVYWYRLQPPRISMRRRLRHEDADEAT
mmetsp:Transcript_117809/g.367078  ORF Transcript_117809/g.367078 Transcript_117809/m.367078 type:complete len:300 (+) Transcript_117809:82-981(+)